MSDAKLEVERKSGIYRSIQSSFSWIMKSSLIARLSVFTFHPSADENMKPISSTGDGVDRREYI